MALNNTATRILVSLIAIPVIVLACYLGGIFFLLFVLLIGLVGFHEISEMLKHKKIYTNQIVGMLSVLLLIANQYYQFVSFQLLLILIVLFLLLYELFRDKSSAVQNLGGTILSILYIGLFSASMIGIREFFNDMPGLSSNGGFLLISILVSIWVCDSAAFFLGSAFGKHKLFPRVSPNKSWEGAIAGFVFAVLAMIAANALVLDFLTLQSSIVIGVIVGVFGQLGDLIESLIKRDAGVKDSSALIPGHGGILDRFDSFLICSPVIYLYLEFFI